MHALLVTFKARRRTLILLLAVGAASIWVWVRDRELVDPDVRRLYADCGNENDPPGLHMPSSPTDRQQFWTRQHWTGDQELKVEVWAFQEPGHRLVSADRQVTGDHIVIEPRWVIPFVGSAAACYEKFGVEVTFHGLPRRDYVIEPR